MRRLLVIALLLSSLMAFTGQSCEFQLGQPSDGGVFRSADKGSTWTQTVALISTDGRKRTFSNVDVRKLVVDIRDSRIMYAATKRFGVFKTVDGGDSWARMYAQDVTVEDVIPDPRSKCVVYIIVGGQLLKTTDCGAQWQIVFNETRKDVQLTSAAINPRDPSQVLLTNTAGELIESDDYGIAWATIYTLERSPFTKIMFDKTDPMTWYLATQHSGIYRTVNAGEQWEEISTALQNKVGAMDYRFMGTLSRNEGVWYVAKGSFFRTFNGGMTWEQVPLLTPPDGASILAATVNPINDDELWYATSTTVYHSVNAGGSWNTSPLPTNRAASYLVMDPYNGDRIFLGVQVYRSAVLQLF